MKKRIFYLIIFFTFLVTSCTSVKEYNQAIEKNHSVKELRSDVDFTFKKIKKLHPNLYWFISKEELNRKIDSVKNSITKPMTSKEFFFVITPLVSEIRQGHNAVGFPLEKLEKEEQEKYEKSKNYFSKLKFESIDNKVIISEIYDTNKGLQYAELLEIDDFKPEYLINKYNKLRCSDGFNQTFYGRRIGLFFKSYYHYENPRLDSVRLLLKLNGALIDTTFYREKIKKTKPDTTEKEKISETDSTSKEDINVKNKKYKLIRGYDETTKTYTRDYRFLEQDSTIMFMKIRGFSNGPSNTFYDEAFEKLDSTQDATLVLDLRDNLGGRLNEIHYLNRYLSETKFKTIEKMESKTKIPRTKAIWSSGNDKILMVVAKGIITPFLFGYEQFTAKKEKGIVYHSMGASKLTDPKENHFKGKVYVLINGNSFSASSIISANLQGSGRAIIIGEETGGTFNGTVAGVFKAINLPNSKIKVQFGMGMIRTPYQESPDGFGVIPDKIILPTLEDRKNGIDTELEFIIDQVRLQRELDKK